MIDFLDKYAAPGWRQAHKMWSIWLALLIAVLNGLWAALPAFMPYHSPTHFALASVALALLMCVARLIKQPGLHDDD